LTIGTQLIHAWRSTLELCRIRPDESVVLLTGPHAHPDNELASQLAVEQLGATLVTMKLNERSRPNMAAESTAHLGPTALTGNRPAMEALRHADVVIDLMGMDRGHEQTDILASGTRILLVKEPPETLVRLIPSAEDKRRVVEATQRVRNSRHMRIESEHGTRLCVEVGQYECLSQYGYADEPGRWDHWPGAFVATWPNERSANGTVVLAPGDTILPFKQYVRTPIRLNIENGYIRSIEGGFDARYLRDYMAMFNDPEGYAVSHLGWGLYSAAHWTALGLHDKRQTNGMEARSFEGNFMFSTGPNLEGGGTRDTPCHLDIPMLDCSLYLDDTPITLRGRIVPAPATSDT